MALQEQIMTDMKNAMRNKDSARLEALRAVKAALLNAKTEKAGGDTMTEEDEIKLVQKLVKQRKDSAAIYKEQGREDLAEPELAQAEVIGEYLPEQLSEKEIAQEVDAVIRETGADGMKDMGKVMGMVSKKLAGKADGKTISNIVRSKLQ